MYVRMGCNMTWTEVALLLRVVRMVKRPSPTEMASRPPWKFSCLVRWRPLAPEKQSQVSVWSSRDLSPQYLNIFIFHEGSILLFINSSIKEDILPLTDENLNSKAIKHTFVQLNTQGFWCHSLTWSGISSSLWWLMLVNFNNILLYSWHYRVSLLKLWLFLLHFS